MKETISILILLYSVLGISFGQNQILGLYEYQTAATERVGKSIDLLPNHICKINSISYGETIETDSGNWSVENDTSLTLKFSDTTISLTIENENRLRRPLYDSSKPEYIEQIFNLTWWTKTKSYYPNGNLESTRSWNSIYLHADEIYKSGKWVYYYENSNIKKIEVYKKGKIKGKPLHFNSNGQEK